MNAWQIASFSEMLIWPARAWAPSLFSISAPWALPAAAASAIVAVMSFMEVLDQSVSDLLSNHTSATAPTLGSPNWIRALTRAEHCSGLSAVIASLVGANAWRTAVTHADLASSVKLPPSDRTSSIITRAPTSLIA